MKIKITLTVNDGQYPLEIAPNRTLLDILREELGLTGTKQGCDSGECGSCTVLMDGAPVLACLTLACEADGAQIQTIEGVAQNGQLHPLQKAFVQHGAIQCGFCTPGMVLSALALIQTHPSPSVQEIKQAISGNFCRCTGYVKIIEAIRQAGKCPP